MRITMLLCDHAVVADGKLYINGGGWSIRPALPVPMYLALKFDVPWDQAGQPMTLDLRLVDEDGHPVVQPGPQGPQEGVFAAPAYPLEDVVDPTGAGDSFAGGFMGALARSSDLSPVAVRRAMFYGSVMASFSVEAFSVERLVDLSRGAIESRYRAFCELTHFESLRIA